MSLKKKVAVEVSGTAFPGQKVPSALKCPPMVDTDAMTALHLLGTLTVPGGFSSASPARHWAWIRYFSSIATSSDLRIVGPFADLDPHQKGILSDDFGVAFGTKWLFDRMGGLSEIVDGRRFLLQYSAFLTKKPKKKTHPKVGPNKCPDFVVRDNTGHWHVLECKGTQSSVDYLKKQLKTALYQKQVIGLAPPVAGFRLAVGLFIGNDLGGDSSIIRVVDPDVDPVVVIDLEDAEKANKAMRRIATARAFGLAGFVRLSDELALPAERGESFPGLYYATEDRRLRRDRKQRTEPALEEVRRQSPLSFQEGTVEYQGRQVVVDIPGVEFYENTGCSRVTIRQGLNAALLQQARLMPVDSEVAERIDDAAQSLLKSDDSITLESSGNRVVIKDGDLFASALEFS